MISYIGGKSRISKFILPHIPRDINKYAEVFGGMFWNFYKMDLTEFKNLDTIVYNDFNQLNVNLFNCVKEYKEFSGIIQQIPSQDKDRFYEYQKEVFNKDLKIDLSKPDFESAYKYAYLLTQVWSGTNPTDGKFIDLKGKYKSKFDTFKDKLQDPKWNKYFDKLTTTENLDFEDFIKKHDAEDMYFYCDPPYYSCEKYYSNHEFGLETHERLAKCLQNMKGKFSLSYYYFPQLEEWFPKDKYRWESADFAKAAGAVAGKEQSIATELLIMNY